MYFLKGQYKIQMVTILGIILQALNVGLCIHFFPLIFKITLKGEEAEAEKLGDFFNYYTSKQYRCSFLYTVN